LTPTVVDCRSIVGVSLVTVIDSDTVSRSSVPLMVIVAPSSRRTPSTFSVRKPCRWNVTRYSPAGSAVNRYTPCSSVTVTRGPPIIAGLVMVMSTPGSNAPLVSSARPVMVLVCASAVPASGASSSAAASANRQVVQRSCAPPPQYARTTGRGRD
jgi:hypothetical protein